MIFEILVIGLIFIVAYLLLDAYRSKLLSRLYWVWDNGVDGTESAPRKKIDTDDIFFPPNFMWGVATSAHQSEGGCRDCQWSDWESSVDNDGKPRIKDSSCSPSLSRGQWNHVDENIELMEILGVNSYRFSIEWSKIQPRQGYFDEQVIAHYHNEIDQLLAAGITPMITLIHFTHPSWFAALGSYEHAENLPYVIEYAKRIFQEFAPKCKHWCTINEPFFDAFGGWMMGTMPPGKRDQALAGIVLRNLLEAHVQIYTTLKSMTSVGASQCQIGIVIAVYYFDPHNPLNLGDVNVASSLHSMFNHTTINFFKTGNFAFRHPASTEAIKHTNVNAPKSNDFIGLNYYSHSFVAYNFNIFNPVKIVVPPTALMSDGVNAALYPEGLYRAIAFVSSLNLPIIITENGCADATDDRRHLFIRRHLYAVSKAIRDGYRVTGYFYWSLFDNFEWVEGYTLKYGLFEVVDEKAETRLALHSLATSSSYSSSSSSSSSSSDSTSSSPSSSSPSSSSSSSSSSSVFDDSDSDSDSSSSSSSSSSSLSSSRRRVRLRDGSKAYMSVIYRFTGRGQYPSLALNNIVPTSLRENTITSNNNRNNSNKNRMRKSSSTGTIASASTNHVTNGHNHVRFKDTELSEPKKTI